MSLTLKAISLESALYKITRQHNNTFFIMPSPHHNKVPRRGDPSPVTVHQSTSYSERTSAWLREDQKDTPWHNIASVATSTADNRSNTGSGNSPSHNPATQGSVQ
ncbi:hypothetical protein NW762_001480 [Fusarium torreyae]|uniref:Uncharacterized protein n=1 Tax=Fusarium torreyae TaxID=1237075 RepID=A0A9W8VL98_9HYPO|nr:hypothetical protein NW762_001480 [Fusarium torreyae]